jgi:hypothetical protein
MAIPRIVTYKTATIASSHYLIYAYRPNLLETADITTYVV